MEFLLSPQLDQSSTGRLARVIEPVAGIVAALPLGCQLWPESVIQLSAEHPGLILCLADILHLYSAEQ
jgi:hypothetical protein